MSIKQQSRLTTVPESTSSFSVDYPIDMKVKCIESDQYTRQNIPINGRQSTVSTNSQSLNKYYNPNPYEIMTKKLCEKLMSIYDELKNKKQYRHRLDIENQKLILKIKEELLERKMTYSKFDEEIKAFKSLTNDYDKYYSDDIYKQRSLLELESQENMIATLKKQIKRSKDELTSEQITIKLGSSKSYYFENEDHKLSKRYKEVSGIVEELTQKLNELQEKIEADSLDFVETQDKISLMNEETSNKELEHNETEELMKETIDNLRTHLMKLSKTSRHREEGEKSLEKSAAELQSRMHRFEVQLNANSILERKIQAFEKVHKESTELMTKIEKTQEDNNILKNHVRTIDPNYQITLETYKFAKEQKKIQLSASSKTPIKASPEIKKNTGYLKKRTASVGKLILSPKMPPSPIGMNTAKNFFNQMYFFEESTKKEEEEDIIKKEKEKEREMEENVKNMLLLSELERLKSQKNSQDDYVWELKKNLDDRISLINNQKKAINSIESDIKIADISILRIQKDIAESAFDYQSQSIVIKKMEDKFYQTIYSFPESVRNFISESLSLNENEAKKSIYEHPGPNFEGAMFKRRTKSTGSTFGYMIKT